MTIVTLPNTLDDYERQILKTLLENELVELECAIIAARSINPNEVESCDIYRAHQVRKIAEKLNIEIFEMSEVKY